MARLAERNWGELEGRPRGLRGWREATPPGAEGLDPARPVRLVVPYPPGGNVDITARIIGPTLGESLGQTIVVDNRGGGGGNVGAHVVAKAPPDGYTLLMGSSGPLSVNPVVTPNLPYDSLKDYAPVSKVHVVPLVVLAGPKSGISTLKELIERAKAAPGKLLLLRESRGARSECEGKRGLVPRFDRVGRPGKTLSLSRRRAGPA